jgi:hypothetical protein
MPAATQSLQLLLRRLHWPDSHSVLGVAPIIMNIASIEAALALGRPQCHSVERPLSVQLRNFGAEVDVNQRARGKQFVAVAAGVKGAVWPVPVTRSGIVVYGLK